MQAREEMLEYVAIGLDGLAARDDFGRGGRLEPIIVRFDVACELLCQVRRTAPG